MANPISELPADTPQYIRDVLNVFTDEEIEKLGAFIYETGEFAGFGFVGPGGKFCRHADPAKNSAITMLERQWLFNAIGGIGWLPEHVLLGELDGS